MEPEHREKVEGAKSDVLLLGKSSWDPEDLSLKYGWPDKNGKISRGGEMPISALPQAVFFAARNDYLTRAEIVRTIKGLVDVLAE
jgi:hypothetical protein